MRVDYSITYRDKDRNKLTWAKELDYFYARYNVIVLRDSPDRYLNVKLNRHTHNPDGTVDVVELEPVRREQYDARYAVFGTATPLVDVAYSSFIRTEGEADAYGRGVELGIARCATFLQYAAANTDASIVAETLEEFADELLIHAPAYHVQYKSLTEALTENAKLKAELAAIKAKASEAKAEYHEKLGETPSIGIMNLPKTREFLETVSE